MTLSTEVVDRLNNEYKLSNCINRCVDNCEININFKNLFWMQVALGIGLK